MIQIEELFLEENYNKLNEIVKGLLIECPDYFELYLVYCKSLIEMGTEFQPSNVSKLVDTILYNVYKVLLMGEETSHSIQSLKKISLSLSSFSISSQILYFTEKYSIKQEYVNSFSVLSKVSTQFNDVNIFDIKNERKRQVLHDTPPKFIQHSNLFSIINHVYANESEGDLDIKSTEKRLYYDGLRSIRSGAIKEGVNTLRKIYERDVPKYFYEEIQLILFESYLSLKKYKEAMVLLVDNYLNNRNYILRTDAKKLIDYIVKTEFKQVNNRIELPLLYHISESASYDQYVAYDRYMEQLNLKRPTEIKSQLRLLHELDNRKLIYFLKNICKIDILRYSYFFEGTSDVEKERINICQYLKEIDKANEVTYNNEIAEISRNASIRKAIQEVNSGRITINIDRLKELELLNWQEGFQTTLIRFIN